MFIRSRKKRSLFLIRLRLLKTMLAYTSMAFSMSRSYSTTSFASDLLSFFSFDYIRYAVFLQIVDPKLASYGVESPIYAVVQLAQTTMRSELGKITLDKTFEERDTLNEKIVVRSLP